MLGKIAPVLEELEEIPRTFADYILQLILCNPVEQRKICLIGLVSAWWHETIIKICIDLYVLLGQIPKNIKQT